MKIIPPAGYRVVRLQFSRAHLWFALGFSVAAFVAIAGSYVVALHREEVRAAELRSLESAQRVRLHSIDTQAAALGGEVRVLERQHAEMEQLIVGGRRGRVHSFVGHARVPRPATHVQAYRPNDDFATVAARIERVRTNSAHLRRANDNLRRLALHVINVRRLQELARVRVLAAIPSLNPAGDGVAIRSPFGWRADPWPEFHEGVDLDADYGDNVRAAADGTVAAAGYDGGFGIKVDIDHGNGYHSWYAHLSRADVTPGERVTKGQHIALVGSTGESTGPHLHYEMMLDGRVIDPTPYLQGVPQAVLASLR
ncbi:MAG: M23 family metallopeptidase [Candidatus Eremiobacteraeota bacterium]|nr:M23 family metallopeptidase [Candidatus Eremiobacteraeota bacterium]MBC5803572.1 M23 family metallopeptidase [Candidatus Eremiobacteraeota bacterium]MBC5822763.1 M23 family metallopeptidase [Candidatus Eremiobacteraeota bacterium]